MNQNKKPPRDMQAVFRKQYVSQTIGRVLVVGSKLYPTRPNWRDWHPDGFGVDMQEGEGVDFVADLERAPLPQKFSHIECVSVLEHTQRPWLVAQNIEAMLRPMGSLFLSVPWCWNFHAYPNDLWRFSHLTLPILFPSIQWRDVRYAHGEVLTESERSPKGDGLPKTQVMGWGVKL